MCEPNELYKQKTLTREVHVESEQQQIQHAPVMMQGMQQVNESQEHAEAPGEQSAVERLNDAALTLNEDTRFFGDSWRMIQVKNALMKFAQFEKTTVSEKTDFETLQDEAVDVFRELIRTCEEYLEARTKNGKGSKRHGKVRAVMEAAKETLEQVGSLRQSDYDAAYKANIPFRTLLRRDAKKRDAGADQDRIDRAKEAMNASRSREHANLYGQQLSILKSDKELVPLWDAFEALRVQQNTLIPMDNKGFDEQKAKLDQEFDKVIARCTEFKAKGAYLNKNKIRRDRVSRLLSQLKWEKGQLAAADFKEISGKVGNQSWELIWARDVITFKASEVSDEFMKNFRYADSITMKDSFYEKYEDDKKTRKKEPVLAEEYRGLEGKSKAIGSKGTRQMAELLGVGNLFAGYRDARLENQRGKRFTGYLEETQGITLSEALKDAEKNNLELIYSNEAIEQLTVIQMLDVICGQLQRTEDSLLVKTAPKSVEGKNYMVIQSVMATENGYSFGTAGFDLINKKGEYSTLRKIWDEKSNRFLLSRYDPAVADRIIALNPQQVAAIFGKMGMDQQQLDALSDRLTSMQRILASDKANPESTRNKYEKDIAQMKQEKQYEQMSDAEKEEFDNERKMRRLAKYSSQYLKKKDIPSYVNPSLVRDVGELKDVANFTYDDGYWSVTDSNQYTDDTLKSVKLRKQKLQECTDLVNEDRDYAKTNALSPEFDRIMNLMLQYSTLDATAERDTVEKSSLAVQEGEIVNELLSKIESRLSELGSMEQSEQVTYETERLKAYREKFIQRNGLLKKPKQLTFDETSFNQGKACQFGDSEGKPLAAKDFKNEKDTPLFPHEPCIQDIAQGSFGDCYFQATVASVVETNPQWIKEHMLDNGDGTVTVKMYDRGNNKKYNPIYIRVKKEIPQDDKGNYSMSRSALWVNLYEKAYILSGLHGKHLEKNANKARKKIKKTKDPEELKKLQELIDKYDKFEDNAKNGIRFYADIEGGFPDKLLDFMIGREVQKIRFDVDLDPDDEDEALKIGYDRRIRQKDGTLKFDGNMDAIVKAAKKDIQDCMDAGQIMVLGSRKNFIDHSGHYGGAGENFERGFASPHAYTIIGLEEKGGITYARLRNPWGREGNVEAVRNQLSGKITFRESEGTYGTFVVDMKTLVTYMEQMTISVK